MKIMHKLIASAIVVLGFSTAGNAQVSATAEAHATIVTPISLTKNVDLNFGNLAVTSTSGTVTMAASALVDPRSQVGGVTFPAVKGTTTAAQFTVKGDGTFGYDITLPTTDVILVHTTANANTMVANAFTTNKTANKSNLVAGEDMFYVGATLAVAAGQVAGLYSNTGFSVTVNYN